MSRKNIIFYDGKINESNIYKNKKPFIIDDIDVTKKEIINNQFLKKNLMVKKAH